jgi:hypothetical protein
MKKIMGALLALSLFVGVATVTFAQGGGSDNTDKKGAKKGGKGKKGTDKGGSDSKGATK